MKQKKYNIPSQKIGETQISGEAIIHDLNQQNITLLPFTFDKFGSIGPLIMSYLYKNENTPSITDENILFEPPTPIPSSLTSVYTGKKQYENENSISIYQLRLCIIAYRQMVW